MTEYAPPRTVAATPTSSLSRRCACYGSAFLLTAVFVAGGYFALRGATSSDGNGDAYEQESPPSYTQAPADYTKWERPLVALVLSGQMHGYVDPCGCSEPQFGGLVRRYNFIESLKSKKWDVVGIDLGELASLEGIHAQRLLKFDLSVKALAAMNYRAFGIGKNEILSGLGEGLAQIYDDKRPWPRPLSLSLAHTDPKELYYDLNVRHYEIIDKVKPKVGVTSIMGVISMMGPGFREELKQEKYLNNLQQLSKALKAFADAGVEVGIVLHHEYPDVDKSLTGFQLAQAIEDKRKGRALEVAKFCADERKKNPKIPEIQLMMVLVEEPEAPAFMKQLDPKLPTQMIEIGHKGKYVGLIGVYRDGKNKFRLQQENVKMGPEWKTKDGLEDKNPVVVLMEQYNRELKRLDMLAQFPRNLHFNQLPAGNQKGLRATFVGSASCQDCHPHAFAVWDKHVHSSATDALENAPPPKGRQFDPECMKCHTTGLKHPGGYNDLIANLANWPAAAAKPDPKLLRKHNTELRGVGCESCHGPGSEHVAHPNNKDLYALINPYRPTVRERELELVVKKNPNNAQEQQKFKRLHDPRMRHLSNFCTQCHDSENDVNWFGKGVDANWRKISHRTPTKNDNAAGNADPAPIVIEVIENQR